MAWIPDQRSLLVPRGPMSHQGAPAWDGGVHCSDTFLPGTERLRVYMQRNFPLIYETGGYECRQNTANPAEMSVHGTGRAIDLMVRKVNGQADRRADEIANWLLRHAESLGLQLIIWDRVLWTNSNPNVVRPYTATSHENHLHIELNEAGARGRTPFFTQGIDGIGVKASSPDDFLIAGLVAAGIYWLLK